VTTHDTVVTCDRCARAVRTIDGVPLYLEETGADDRGRGGGLAHSTFERPRGYRSCIGAKYYLQSVLGVRDAELGVDETVRDKSVLDVGCGPALDLPNAENGHVVARRYVGIDTSASFVLAARARHADPKFDFAQASALDLPFDDKSFDVVLASFLLHHVHGDLGRVIDEFTRVARSHVVIFDHLRSEQYGKQRVQGLYWRVFDGGFRYLTAPEWDALLARFAGVRRARSGILFGHVVKFVCEVPASTS
jgi:SAM-dependent methyltransferase